MTTDPAPNVEDLVMQYENSECQAILVLCSERCYQCHTDQMNSMCL